MAGYALMTVELATGIFLEEEEEKKDKDLLAIYVVKKFIGTLITC